MRFNDVEKSKFSQSTHSHEEWKRTVLYLRVLGVGVLCAAFFIAAAHLFYMFGDNAEVPDSANKPRSTVIAAPSSTQAIQGTLASTTATTSSREPSVPVKPIPKDPVPTQTSPSAPHHTGTLDYRFGMAMGERLSVLSEGELASTLDDLVSLGVGWIRVDLAWSTVQQYDRDTYTWVAFDRVVTEARRRGMEVLPILTYTPHWARSDACPETNKCEPVGPDDFVAFAREAVRRYRDKGIHTWEVWNEPNLAYFWRPAASPERYTTLLKKTYRAIHEEDARATVVTGGLAAVATVNGNVAPREFLERIYTADGKGYFDAVGFHPYSFPLAPGQYKKSNAWSQITDTEWSMRSVMVDRGDGDKKLWLTEYGAPTGGPGNQAENGDVSWFSTVPDHVTDEYQAELLEEAVTLARGYSFAGPFFWYSYKDIGTKRDTKENFFGILRADGSQKPAYFTLAKLLGKE